MSMTVIYSDLGDVDCSCLPLVWQGIPDVKVLTLSRDSQVTRQEVMDAIADEDDTIFFCGHGTPSGLLGFISKEEVVRDRDDRWDMTRYGAWDDLDDFGMGGMGMTEYIAKSRAKKASPAAPADNPTAAKGSEDRPVPEKRTVMRTSYGTAVDWDMLKDTLHARRILTVWCNSDMFAEKHNLPGFWTSMFISNSGEARYCGFPNVPNEVIVKEVIHFCKDLNILLKNDVPQDQWIDRLIADGHMDIPTTEYNYKGLRYYPY